MTRSARLTQKRLEGEILGLLDGIPASLFTNPENCSFCKKYGVMGSGIRIGNAFYLMEDCSRCPVCIYLENRCSDDKDIKTIDSHMKNCTSRAIPGALAIYMWLEEL